jgi:ribosomal protein L22
MVITSLRKRGRLTKAMKIAREERESHYKSPFLPTSIKKLTKVMNQIAGKTVEEALVQLRFSKKKVARDVWKGLKMARDEAIVARGMGLGKVQHEPSEEEWKAIQEEAAQKKADKIAEAAKKEADDKATREAHRSKDPKALENWLAKQEEAKQAEHERRLEQLDANDSVNLTPTEKLELLLPDGMRRPTKAGKATLIELKDGRSKRVHDPSEMYVDQAWVGRGTPGKSVEYRARGQMNILEHRTTCKLPISQCAAHIRGC